MIRGEYRNMHVLCKQERNTHGLWIRQEHTCGMWTRQENTCGKWTRQEHTCGMWTRQMLMCVWTKYAHSYHTGTREEQEKEKRYTKNIIHTESYKMHTYIVDLNCHTFSWVTM